MHPPFGSARQPPKRIPLREVLRLAPRTLRLVLDTDRTSAIGMVLLGFVAALVPLATAYIGKLIIDGVLAASAAGARLPEAAAPVLHLVWIEAGLMVLLALFHRAGGLLKSVLGVKLGHDLHLRILKKALTLELRHFEDPEVYDRMQNARREASTRPINLFVNATGLAKDLVTLLSYGAVLSLFSGWAAAVLVLSTIPAFVAEAKFSGEAFRLFTWRAPEGRKLNYLEWILTRDNHVQEVKLYGIGGWVISNYERIYQRMYGEERSLATRRATYGFLLGSLSTLAFYGCYAWIVAATIRGAFTLGEMTLYLTIFRQGQGAMRSILTAIGSTYEDNLFMSNLYAFLDLECEALKAPASPAAADQPARIEAAAGRSGFELEGVSFRYPGQKGWALHGIDLRIGAEEKIAIIGDNGAGKTTLIKLLTGMYEPTEGVIRLDGIPLSAHPREELRRRFAVVLQDFARYQFTARENIGLGRVAEIDDRELIARAAERGGATAVIESLRAGLDTQLGRWFEDGVELSSGQWQKLAVARAFMRDSQILILDEPTAALDAEAEHALFERFRQLADGKMAILISHRFSTVRMADRIVVLRDGRIQEAGNHSELLAAEGRYAHLFRIQARGYLDAFS